MIFERTVVYSDYEPYSIYFRMVVFLSLCIYSQRTTRRPAGGAGPQPSAAAAPGRSGGLGGCRLRLVSGPRDDFQEPSLFGFKGRLAEPLKGNLKRPLRDS